MKTVKIVNMLYAYHAEPYGVKVVQVQPVYKVVQEMLQHFHACNDIKET